MPIRSTINQALCPQNTTPKKLKGFPPSVGKQPVTATLAIQGYVDSESSGSTTCFVIPFVVEFSCDLRVPVAQLDRAAAF